MPEENKAVQTVGAEQPRESVESSTETLVRERRNTDLKQVVKNLEQYRRAQICAKKTIEDVSTTKASHFLVSERQTAARKLQMMGSETMAQEGKQISSLE